MPLLHDRERFNDLTNDLGNLTSSEIPSKLYDWTQEIPRTIPTEQQIRAIARDEIASLAGLVLRRLQEAGQAADVHAEQDPNADPLIPPATLELFSAVFGEALQQYAYVEPQVDELEDVTP